MKFVVLFFVVSLPLHYIFNVLTRSLMRQFDSPTSKTKFEDNF